MPMLLPNLSGALYLEKESNLNFEKVGAWGDESPLADNFPAEECVSVRRGLSYLTKAEESVLFCKHLSTPPPAISLCLPLSAQGETFGILHLQCKEYSPQRLEDKEATLDILKQDFAETVAKQVAMALASLRLKELLRNQSIRDPLTGLFNRRYMEETFDREFSRSVRNNVSIAFIMIDIDHFKKVNDTYGHETGDEVLRELGRLMQNLTRNEDIACRYGGEEFVICLPNTEVSTARARAESIRESMLNRKFYCDGKDIGNVTVSLGVAAYPVHGNKTTDLIKAADKALYHAKKTGRNKVIVAHQPPVNEITPQVKINRES